MQRSDFLKLILATPFGMKNIKEVYSQLTATKDESDIKMPVLFISHGSPLNAIQTNPFTEAIKKIGQTLPIPKAIMVVSAHWLTKSTYVTASSKPNIIYDFYGFPQSLYDVKYPVAGAAEYATLTTDIQQNKHIMLDHEWGIDHGAWTILLHMFPKADIPVYQMSIDTSIGLSAHYELASMLRILRRKGVLIIGSGNVTHNLGKIDWNVNAKPFDWAMEFDEKVKQAVSTHNFQALIKYEQWGNNLAKINHPSDDHYLPLLYSAGFAQQDDKVEYIYEGFHHGSLSMRCIKFG